MPAARINYVRVVINGESWGVYLNAEQFNSDFVRDRFKDKGGARWKVPGSPIGRGGMAYLGENIDAYRGIYDIKSRDDRAIVAPADPDVPGAQSRRPPTALKRSWRRCSTSTAR